MNEDDRKVVLDILETETRVKNFEKSLLGLNPEQERKAILDLEILADEGKINKSIYDVDPFNPNKKASVFHSADNKKELANILHAAVYTLSEGNDKSVKTVLSAALDKMEIDDLKDVLNHVTNKFSSDISSNDSNFIQNQTNYNGKDLDHVINVAKQILSEENNKSVKIVLSAAIDKMESKDSKDLLSHIVNKFSSEAVSNDSKFVIEPKKPVKAKVISLTDRLKNKPE